MPLVLAGATSGSTTIQATDAVTQTLTLPAQTATLITDSSGVLNIGSGQVYKDASGNVGIGTTSPGAKLDVSGTSRYRIDTSNSYTLTASVNPAVSAFVDSYYNANLHIWQTSGTERMRIDSSGNLLFNSGYGSVATAFGCRAWVNFNGTGTVAIRASGNVTSITDNGVGLYTVNFTNGMPDVNYATFITTQATTASNFRLVPSGTYSTSAVQVDSTDATQSARADVPIYNVAIFR